MSESTTNPMLSGERRTEDVAFYAPSFRTWVTTQLQAIDEMETAGASDQRKKRQALKMAQELDAKLANPKDIPGTRVFTFGRVDPAHEKALKDRHPPRKGNAHDAAEGCNVDEFRPALMYACLLEPAVSLEQFEEWRSAEANTGEFEKAWAAVARVQYGVIELPKLSAVSALQARRETASRQQHDTE